jgi:hypothetical protein
MEKEKEYVPSFCFRSFNVDGDKVYCLLLDNVVIEQYPRDKHIRRVALSRARAVVDERLADYTGKKPPVLKIMQ